MQINDRETATVLAALRFYQRLGTGAAHPEERIATNDGDYPPMSVDDIDALCERINVGERG